MYETTRRAAAFMTVLLVAACGLFGPSESHEDGEEEESGTQLTKSQTYDEVRNGCRLILRYDAATNAFKGTAQQRHHRHAAPGTGRGPPLQRH